MNSISVKFIYSILGSHLGMFNVPILIGWFLIWDICEHVAIVKRLGMGSITMKSNEFNYNYFTNVMNKQITYS